MPHWRRLLIFSHLCPKHYLLSLSKLVAVLTWSCLRCVAGSCGSGEGGRGSGGGGGDASAAAGRSTLPVRYRHPSRPCRPLQRCQRTALSPSDRRQLCHNSFRTAVPFSGRTAWNFCGLSANRDCGLTCVHRCQISRCTRRTIDPTSLTANVLRRLMTYFLTSPGHTSTYVAVN